MPQLDITIQARYRKAITMAQNGKPDNEVKQMRYYVLHQLAEQSIERFPYSDLVECGCWHGHSTIFTAELAQSMFFNGGMHVFDSFEGLSEFKPQDQCKTFDTKAKQQAERAHFASNEARLRALVEPYGFVKVYRGWIPGVFAKARLSENGVAFAMIDVDLYEPTLASLRFAYFSLRHGGAIFFDDYGYENFPGAKTAVDEFVARVKPTTFVALPFGSAFLIK